MSSELVTLTVISAAIFLSPVQMEAQAPASEANPAAKEATVTKAKSATVPHLPDGRPDLGGYWSNNTVAPLERPQALAGKEFLTDDEARALEKNSRERTKASDFQASQRPGEVGDYNAAFKEDSRWALPNKRTSIITDPKDGRMPPLTPEAHNYQIIQTHDHLMSVTEMIHDTRIIPLDGRPHENIGQWMGDSRGHWEDDTLVVETNNFNGKRGWFGTPMTEGGGGKRPDAKMRVVERFTRTAPDILLYQFTIDDPGIFTKPWSGEIPMKSTGGPVYEYACHEANYSMVDILSGARAEEREAAEAARNGSK